MSLYSVMDERGKEEGERWYVGPMGRDVLTRREMDWGGMRDGMI